ncbi:hypothetical protein [Pantoea phage LIMEzero]|uniref:Rz1A protein n=1 Tax=Pantoea phage LIMEzero TaxID=943335 RepID=F4N9V6_9CAUD|nr:Rz-like spanin [Pantoea phage LIMEzero]CBY88584.1 hypothetical protein [Pantoea phage LIMEzero]
MKLSQLFAGAVLSLSLTLTGCAATSLLSAATSAISPNKPEITAQVGAENTKQGIGVTAKTSEDTKVGDVSGNAKVENAKQGKESSTVKDVSGNAKVDTAKQGEDSVTVKDVTGGAVNASKQGSQVTQGNVQAKQFTVNQGDSRGLLWAFSISMGAFLILVFGLVLLFLKLRKGKVNGSPTDTTSETTT